MKSVKYLFLCFFALFFFNNIIRAQCPQGDVILTTQVEVDDFAAAYPSCTEITGILQIGDFPNTSDITDLSNLPPIEAIDGTLGIEKTALTDLSGLESLTSISGDLIIYANDALTDLSGLENVTSIGDYLRIYANNALTDLSGLENVTSIGGDFEIWDNAILTDLSGLENVTLIGGYLIISANGALTDLSGMENLTSIGGYLIINYNDTLTDLSGLESVTSIGDYLRIYANDALTDLSGLENLTSIGGDLVDIGLNDALTDLSGLENVTSIEGDLIIRGNAILTNLSGLENLTSIGGDLSIIYNPTLSICAIPPICDYLESGGNSDIYDNAPNCNSAEEILALCTVSTTTPDNLPQITISPNPTNSTFILQGIPQGTYQIHDTTGRIIQSGNMQNDLSIDISQEARGVYFISIQIENETITKRMIKM